jgi:methionine-S-sulfoxide reductase
VRTRVGYSGGTLELPTYRKIGDHSESIQIDFDPEHISYRQLVQEFWRGHDPTTRSWSRQYMSVAFYHDSEQQQILLETKAGEEGRLGAPIKTEIHPAGKFYRAEDYHQKYYLRQHRQLADEYISIYPEPGLFTDSTATARVNGYLGGNGTLLQLESELALLGLSPVGQTHLREQFDYLSN